MKPLIQRIRWQRIGYLAVAVMAVGAIGFGYYKDSQATQLVEYHRVVESGDTLWSICASIATDKKDMGRLVWEVGRDNKISDPGNLQPGTELVIRVKRAREL